VGAQPPGKHPGTRCRCNQHWVEGIVEGCFVIVAGGVVDPHTGQRRGWLGRLLACRPFGTVVAGQTPFFFVFRRAGRLYLEDAVPDGKYSEADPGTDGEAVEKGVTIAIDCAGAEAHRIGYFLIGHFRTDIFQELDFLFR
jgi:hypothetical protein